MPGPNRIPFNKPFFAGREEIEYITEAIRLGHTHADGHFSDLCHRCLEERFGIHAILMTSSGTAALEIAAMLCGLGPGDEVLMLSYTFVSAANAVVRCGAWPVFVDIRADTMNIDETLLEAARTERTKAVFPMHYAGVACELAPIMDFAARMLKTTQCCARLAGVMK